MKEYKFAESFAFMIGYFLLSIIIMMLSGAVLSVWLGFNVALAVIPFILIMFLSKRMEQKSYAFDTISVLVLVGFILFLPNTFYVITDMIHINSEDFYRNTSGVIEYKDQIESYFLLFHIFVSAVIGVYLGIKSLILFDQIIANKTEDKKLKGMIFGSLLIVSSFGIYIGRFLRLFSWDVLNPVKLFNEIVSSFDLFMFTFVITFSIVQYLLYYGYKLVFEKEPFHQ